MRTSPDKRVATCLLFIDILYSSILCTFCTLPVELSIYNKLYYTCNDSYKKVFIYCLFPNPCKSPCLNQSTRRARYSRLSFDLSHHVRSIPKSYGARGGGISVCRSVCTHVNSKRSLPLSSKSSQ
jgi:hypothetical protein